MKSKLAIIQDYIKAEVFDIFKGTKWDTIKENIYFQDEFPQNESPDDKLVFIYSEINQAGGSMQMQDEYLYDISFTFVYNKTYGHRDLAEIEDYFDIQFMNRYTNQNEQGLWFYDLIKNGVEKIDDGISTQTILSSSYSMRVYFK